MKRTPIVPGAALLATLEARYHRSGAAAVEWPVFKTRLLSYYPAAAAAFLQLYGHDEAAEQQLEQTLCCVLDRWCEREPELRQLDAERELNAGWFNGEQHFGASCYVDRFATDLPGLIDKVPYLAGLGVSYLYLMPIFKCPAAASDGGFAVSSYQELAAGLGSMADLRRLTAVLRRQGISLALDFILNHTSDEYEWAQKAAEGDAEYEAYYHIFGTGDRELIDEYNANAFNPFPDQGQVINYHERIGKWVWTDFYLFQWDLNYANPAVFRAMLDNALFLANQGVEVLRLDAVPLIWKKRGTRSVCEPECHLVIQGYKAFMQMAAPGVKFKSEAIMAPHEVAEFISPQKCDLSYRPMLTALLWESLASGNSEFLAYCVKKWYRIDPHCTWINYVNNHDDIFWCFSDADAWTFRNGVDPALMRGYLEAFYTGQMPASFARGLPFQTNPQTGFSRISGTLASLAGLELALEAGSASAVDAAVRRIRLLHAVVLSIGGLPMIFLGDEVGTLNDYSYREDAERAMDSRWVHRPQKDWEHDARVLADPNSPGARIHHDLLHLLSLRRSTAAFAGSALRVINSDSPSLFAYIRGEGELQVLVIANFSAYEEELDPLVLQRYGYTSILHEQISGRVWDTRQRQWLQPCEVLWLVLPQPDTSSIPGESSVHDIRC